MRAMVLGGAHVGPKAVVRKGPISSEELPWIYPRARTVLLAGRDMLPLGGSVQVKF